MVWHDEKADAVPGTKAEVKRRAQELREEQDAIRRRELEQASREAMRDRQLVRQRMLAQQASPGCVVVSASAPAIRGGDSDDAPTKKQELTLAGDLDGAPTKKQETLERLHGKLAAASIDDRTLLPGLGLQANGHADPTAGAAAAVPPAPQPPHELTLKHLQAEDSPRALAATSTFVYSNALQAVLREPLRELAAPPQLVPRPHHQHPSDAEVAGLQAELAAALLDEHGGGGAKGTSASSSAAFTLGLTTSIQGEVGGHGAAQPPLSPPPPTRGEVENTARSSLNFSVTSSTINSGISSMSLPPSTQALALASTSRSGYSSVAGEELGRQQQLHCSTASGGGDEVQKTDVLEAPLPSTSASVVSGVVEQAPPPPAVESPASIPAASAAPPAPPPVAAQDEKESPDESARTRCCSVM
jgi:hypothetical protein